MSSMTLETQGIIIFYGNQLAITVYMQVLQVARG